MYYDADLDHEFKLQYSAQRELEVQKKLLFMVDSIISADSTTSGYSG